MHLTDKLMFWQFVGHSATIFPGVNVPANLHQGQTAALRETVRATCQASVSMLDNKDHDSARTKEMRDDWLCSQTLMK